MDKRELKETVESKRWNECCTAGEYRDGKADAYEDVLDLIDQLDEPEKPVIPQFVADWIEKCKEENETLSQVYSDLRMSEANVIKWLYHEGDKREKVDLLARAWLDGYEVEKEPKYIIKLDDESYLQRYEIDNKNVVTPFRIVGHLKEIAIKFDNKERAEKVAELVEGKVEELEE